MVIIYTYTYIRRQIRAFDGVKAEKRQEIIQLTQREEEEEEERIFPHICWYIFYHTRNDVRKRKREKWRF